MIILPSITTDLPANCPPNNKNIKFEANFTVVYYSRFSNVYSFFPEFLLLCGINRSFFVLSLKITFFQNIIFKQPFSTEFLSYCHIPFCLKCFLVYFREEHFLKYFFIAPDKRFFDNILYFWCRYIELMSEFFLTKPMSFSISAKLRLLFLP